MKPFIFKENEYYDLNSLGLAFLEDFDLAIELIKKKDFIKFVNHFKNYKSIVKSILFETYYLQNALSLIIYNITEEHILYIGHKRYSGINDILDDIKLNTAFKFFAFDKGFSKTILNQIEDEKLKNDLVSFENNHLEDICVKYLASYRNNDSIEVVTEKINSIMDADDKFIRALEIFKDENVLLSLANHYSLSEVLELQKRNCPVFKGLEIAKDIIPTTVLDNAFYHSLLSNYKKYKYKGKEGKGYRIKIKKIIKEFKGYEKLSATQRLELEEKLYNLYLLWVDMYKLGKITIRNEALAPTIPYADTYISEETQDNNSLTETDEKPYQSTYRYEYSLNKFDKSFKNHFFFSSWCITFIIFLAIFYVCFGLMPEIRNSIVGLFNQQESDLEIPAISHLLFVAGVGIAFLVAILFLVLRGIEKRKYKQLCKIAYYRNHINTLNDDDRSKYEALKIREEKYARGIDKFYRFYGGIGLAGLSLAITINTLALLFSFGFLLNGVLAFDVSLQIVKLLNDKLVFIFIVPAIVLGLSLLRHKKTAWSVWFCFFVSLILAVVILFI